MPELTLDGEKAYRAARRTLLFWGAAMILVYFAFVLVFPLVPHIYRGGAMLDLELILRDGKRALVWVYIAGLGILFFAFWRIVRALHRFSLLFPESAWDFRKPVLTISLLCGFVLLGLYPITALDVAVYVINARNWAFYDANPLLVPPSAFPDDPYARFAGEYADKTSPYGPLWELFARIPIQLGMRGIVEGILAMKLISLLALAGAGFLVGWRAVQQNKEFGVGGATALAFFVLNPLVLLEAVGNGHNDMAMAAFIVLGLVLWQRGRWAWAAFALTLASLVKLPALIFVPLFGLSVLMESVGWRQRLLRGLGSAAIFIGVFFVSYCMMGPFPDVFSGVLQSFGRRSFSPAYAAYVIVREAAPAAAGVILPNTRYVFLLAYAWIAAALLRRKLTLLEAGFWAYFALIYLSNAFRFWYLLWLLPFAALILNSRVFWRIFLFSLAVEFSVLSYYVLWRWRWHSWEWGLNGPLAAHWDYYKIMTPFTVSWTFTIPFLGDLIGRLRDKVKFNREFWV